MRKELQKPRFQIYEIEIFICCKILMFLAQFLDIFLVDFISLVDFKFFPNSGWVKSHDNQQFIL